MLKLIPTVSMAVALLANDARPWADKQIANWTEEDAKALLDDSPWSKTVEASVERSSGANQGRGGGMGRRGGMGGGGIGIDLPGGGMGRRGGGYPGGRYPSGGGYPGGGYPGGGSPGGGGYPGGRTGGDGRDSAEGTPTEPLHLRWESAMPVRAAELKTHDSKAPTLDGEDQYAIAVYGIESRFVGGAPKDLVKELKKDAALKREGKPDIKPSGVEVLEETDGPVIVYLFPRAKEISSKDRRIEFDAKVGRLKFTQVFFPDEMTFQGKLEL